MASTRKPTFKPGATDLGATKPGTTNPGATAPGVISAERTLDDDASQPAKAKAPAKANTATVLAFPEPKGRRRKRIVLTVIGVVVALVAALMAAVVYSPLLAVRTVTVDGTKLLKADAVRKALAPVEGTPLPQVDDAEIARLLKPLVQVRSVSTEARPPSTLLVHVVERVPVALLKKGDTYQLVDVDGVQLGSTKDPATVPLPLIDGSAAKPELFKAITAVLATLPPDVLAKMASASAKSPDAVELKLVDGKTVVWGNAEEKELKARVLEALLKAPADPQVPVNVYDVSAPRHPLTK
ncbi:peptidase S33 [Arthrobacter sp. SW1]|uniref:FtsQ-type POTRA domain-containing protein n=1 Tax=Arthrobacter sp. SW1 TaxID=1920889 RepID=UPI000877D7D5|nr:FtsQ-type POTRA domain-containing protein [Arthrobacter sp. SW1]OFI38330.1 peptidase S33 [Arthrobacter sp. SW1]